MAGGTSEPSSLPDFDTEVERGEHLFVHMGCAGCHGERAAGGVPNENDVLGTVPRLDEMAERLMLFEAQDAELVVRAIEQGDDPSTLRGDPFPGYARFVAQFDAVDGIIEDGAVAAKADPDGPAPPLQMPSWKERLTERDIRAIVACLITLYPREGGEE